MTRKGAATTLQFRGGPVEWQCRVEGLLWGVRLSLACIWQRNWKPNPTATVYLLGL